MGVLLRVLSRLNTSVWNILPRKVPIFTIAKDGITVTVKDLKLTWTEASGGSFVTIPGTVFPDQNGTYVLNLATLTIAELQQILSQYGFTVNVLNASYNTYLARGMIDQRIVGEGTVYYPTSLLWMEMMPQCWDLEDQKNRITAASKELYLHTADGSWLDWWAEHFLVPRNDGESDSSFFSRIVAETIKPKANNYAMAESLRLVIGNGASVTVEDAYQVVADPPLHDGTEVHDGTWLHNANVTGVFYGYFHVRVEIPIADTRTDAQVRTLVQATIDKLKAAGTLLLTTDVDRV